MSTNFAERGRRHLWAHGAREVPSDMGSPLINHEVDDVRRRRYPDCAQCKRQRTEQAKDFLRTRRINRNAMIQCSHVWGSCSNRDALGLVPLSMAEHCDNCDNWYCLSHHHMRPTGVAGQRCDTCDELQPRCRDMWTCDGCGDRMCDRHDHDYCSGYEDDHVPVNYRDVELTFIAGQSHEYARGKRYVGFEVEVENASSAGQPDVPAECGITSDGSLSDGIEVITPPRTGDELVRMVRDVMEGLEQAGYEVSTRCGLHTHIDMRDKVEDPVFLSRLFATFYAVEDVLFAMQETRRHTGSYARPMRAGYEFYGAYGMKASDFEFVYNKVEKNLQTATRVKEGRSTKWGDQRYNAFNFHSVFHRGSLEIRIHEGTLDAERILLWADLLQSIIAKVEKGVRYKDLEALLAMPASSEKVALMTTYFSLSADVSYDVLQRVLRRYTQSWSDALGKYVQQPFDLGPYVLGTPKKGRAKSLNPAQRARRATHWGCPDCSTLVAIEPNVPLQPHNNWCGYGSSLPRPSYTILWANGFMLGNAQEVFAESSPRTALHRQILAMWPSIEPARTIRIRRPTFSTTPNTIAASLGDEIAF